MKLAIVCASYLALFSPLIHGLPVDSESSSGFFMQVTDFHMDTHYVSGSDTSALCHRKESLGDAGKYGALNSICDSPPVLVEEAFKFMKTLPSIDFVLYTGDSARHNRDKKEIPRTYDEALDAQTTIVKHFLDTFDTSKTKVVPLIGNNDVPKNNDCSGDDPAYKQIRKIWEPLHLNIEQDFEKGGYYEQELISGKLRVLNTNTMLFSAKNKLTKEDCDENGSPGQLHMAWLKAHLEDARSHQYKVYISAHVPPNSKRDRVFYKPVCYNQYYGLLGDYADVILGHFAGHFNNDVLTAVVDGPGLDQFDGPVKADDDDKNKDKDKDTDTDNDKDTDTDTDKDTDTDTDSNDAAAENEKKIKRSNGDDQSKDKQDKSNGDDESAETGSDAGTESGDDETQGQGNKHNKHKKIPTHGTGKAIVSEIAHKLITTTNKMRKRGHKKSYTTSELHPPYGHIALLGKPFPPLPSSPKVLGILFNSPSIVPLNNPGIRVYEYETKGDGSVPIGTILNYKQYYADLQEANASGELTFKLEYDAAELYGVKRFDKEGMSHILDTMATQFDKVSQYTRVKNPLPPPPEDD